MKEREGEREGEGGGRGGERERGRGRGREGEREREGERDREGESTLILVVFRFIMKNTVESTAYETAYGRKLTGRESAEVKGGEEEVKRERKEIMLIQLQDEDPNGQNVSTPLVCCRVVASHEMAYLLFLSFCL